MKEILELALEVEGLLLLLHARGDEAPAEALELLREKTRRLSAAIETIELPAATPDAPAVPEPAAPVGEPVVDDLPVVDDQPDHSDEDEPREVFGAGGYVEPTKVAPPVAPAAPAAAEAPAVDKMRVDEKLQRAMARELRRAFSLNDRFRFRRELFGNNDAMMDDALRRVQDMENYAQAERYFLQDLGWDADDATVAEFLAIVRNHLD